MSSDTVVRARIDAEIKDEATKALAAMGLSVSDAIRMLLTRVASERELPFAVKVPNAESKQAMDELMQGKGKRLSSRKDLFDDLDL